MKKSVITPNLSDSDFIRGSLPMTKEEVRFVSVCKLHLEKNSVVYDIGSGTGSVAVEIARLSPDISVYAVEVEADGIELIKTNAQKFGCDNIHVVQNLAPEGFDELPSPTHAFIGGSKGKLKEILATLREKNPRMRVVITAVSLETLAEIQSALKTFSVTDDEIIQLSVSRAEKAGSHSLLKAQNPVFICSFTFEEPSAGEA